MMQQNEFLNRFQLQFHCLLNETALQVSAHSLLRVKQMTFESKTETTNTQIVDIIQVPIN